MTWPVDWIGAVVADGVELPDGCRHTDRISAMLTPRWVRLRYTRALRCATGKKLSGIGFPTFDG